MLTFVFFKRKKNFYFTFHLPLSAFLCEEHIKKVNQFHLSEKVSYSNSYFCNFAILYILCSRQKSLIFFLIGSEILHINLLACKFGAHAVRIRIGDFYLLVNGRVIPDGRLQQCP